MQTRSERDKQRTRCVQLQILRTNIQRVRERFRHHNNEGARVRKYKEKLSTNRSLAYLRGELEIDLERPLHHTVKDGIRKRPPEQTTTKHKRIRPTTSAEEEERL